MTHTSGDRDPEGGQGPFRCQIEDLSDIAIVQPAGELDLAVVQVFRNALDSALRSRRHIIVDMSGLRYIDSTGLKELALCHQRSREYGQTLVMITPPAPLRKLVEIMRLDHMIPVFDSLTRAVSFVRGER